MTEETPHGHGAVSVVLVRGPGASERVREALGWSTLTIGVPRVGRVRLRGRDSDAARASTGVPEDLDEAVVCALAADRVELHVHGSPVLVHEVKSGLERVLGVARGPGVPVTVEERARAASNAAASEAGARILLDQAEGAWRSAMRRAAEGAWSDDDVRACLERSRVARFALRPSRVVLAGAVNAGKSTLFNVLVGEDRAITSDEPGTTRDLVRARARLGAYPVDLIDTAGERGAGDPALDGVEEIEAAGIALARAAREGADLVLWLVDAAHAAYPDLHVRELARDPRVVVVRSRADLAPGAAFDGALDADAGARAGAVALRALRDPAATRATVARLFREHARLPEDPWTPGAACAFDDLTRERLARLAAASPAERRAIAAAEANECRGASEASEANERGSRPTGPATADDPSRRITRPG